MDDDMMTFRLSQTEQLSQCSSDAPINKDLELESDENNMIHGSQQQN